MINYVSCNCYYIFSATVEKSPTDLYSDEYYYHPLEAQSVLFIQVISH